MIQFINAITGGEMWVHPTRVDEYLALGHKIADPEIAAVFTDVSTSNTPAKPKPKTKKAAKAKE